MDTDCVLCGKCCEDTEMLLSNEDVTRIKNQTNLSKREFMFNRDGYLYLKNKGRYCVFLNHQNKRCTIYEIRPRGCRFYPIIYDPYDNQCIVDRDCTNKRSINVNLVEQPCPSLQEFIILLERERKERLRLL